MAGARSNTEAATSSVPTSPYWSPRETNARTFAHHGWNPIVFPLPPMPIKFHSIATQVAEAIRAEIASGRWSHLLPGERQLAERLHVSRKTVRKALAALRSEGMLDTRQSRGSILKSRRRRNQSPSQRIALLLPEPLEGSRPFTAHWVNRLMTLLQESGDRLQIFHGAK